MKDFPKDLCIPMRSALNKQDSETQTFGCRQNNPSICGFCFMDGVCAFVTSDNICHHPSARWKKVYKELKDKIN